MKKLLSVLIAVLLFCVPAFAETEPAETELFDYIGKSFDEIFDALGGETERYHFEDGISAYLNNNVSARYVGKNTLNHGWEERTVFYISVSDPGYTLWNIGDGDRNADVAPALIEEGWVEMAEAPKYCDIGYEITIENVKYTMAFIYDHDDVITLVDISAEKLNESEDVGSLDLPNIGD